MIVSEIAVRQVGDQLELSALATSRRRQRFRVWFSFPQSVGALPGWGDPFLAGLLAPCMYAREEIFIDAPVSRRLLGATRRIQSLLAGWHADLTPVGVRCSATHDGAGRRSAAPSALFYSAGVDSLYSLCKHQRTVEQLILIHGLENPVLQEALLTTTLTAVRAQQQVFSKELVVVRTNLRAVADQAIAPWSRRSRPGFFAFCYLGSMLAAVALCLQRWLGRVIISASYPAGRLVPYGSHPLLDPLWSTEDLELVHDGCEASRLQKVRSVAAQAPLALAHLQVCERNLPQESNCCRCDRCQRTMAALRLCGCLPDTRTLDRAWEPRALAGRAQLRRWRSDYEELLAEARAQGDRKLTAALEQLLCGRLSWQKLQRQLAALSRRVARHLPRRAVDAVTGARARRW